MAAILETQPEYVERFLTSATHWSWWVCLLWGGTKGMFFWVVGYFVAKLGIRL
jgi:hypothetical protein